MGIKFLNKYLMDKCKSIKRVHLESFRDKKIVIDTSIYIYKFLSENALLENMHKMVLMFQKYNITPVFIFDGKPPPEKRELLDQRYLSKCKAQEKYDELLAKNESANEKELLALKSQFIKIKEHDITRVKELFDGLGVQYYVSTTESDPLCAYFVNSKKSFACLTEDMDMFAYGCHRIIRNLDFTTHEIQYYNIQLILKDLKMCYKHFKQILVLSGTDYDIQSGINLYTTLSLFENFKKTLRNNYDDKKCFYEWLEKYNPSYIKNRDKLNHCFEMFNVEYHLDDLEQFTQKPAHSIIQQ
jgi:flap endonuclease-1